VRFVKRFKRTVLCVDARSFCRSRRESMAIASIFTLARTTTRSDNGRQLLGLKSGDWARSQSHQPPTGRASSTPSEALACQYSTLESPSMLVLHNHTLGGEPAVKPVAGNRLAHKATFHVRAHATVLSNTLVVDMNTALSSALQLIWNASQRVTAALTSP